MKKISNNVIELEKGDLFLIHDSVFLLDKELDEGTYLKTLHSEYLKISETDIEL